MNSQNLTQEQATQAPTGFNSTTPPPLGSNTPPSVAIPGGPLKGDPQMPGSQPISGPVVIPAHWNDRVRIIALILALYDQDPAEAIRVGDLVEAKLTV